MAFLLAGCNNESAEKQQADQITEAPVPSAGSVATATRACYLGNSGRDTITLSFTSTGNKVNGNLHYKFYEKDQSQGPVSGEMKGDTLIADYRFASEGMQSLREVIFLKKDDGFVEGYGDMEEKNGKMIFKNRSGLKFGQGFLLRKVDCN